MRSHQVNRFARFPLGRAFKSILAAACLIVSAQAAAQSLTQSQNQAVTNLSTASGAIKTQVSLGTTYSNAIAAASQNGTIVDPVGDSRSIVTETQRNTYNSAISTFNATSFYSAQQMLQAASLQAKTNMQTAITDLAAAAADLQKAAQVNQMLSTVTDAPTAKAAQTAITAAGLSTEITAAQVAVYNSSLANVNTYASQTAAFMRAAQSQKITGNIDTFTSQYGQNLDYATASFAYASGAIAVSWNDGLSIVQNGVMNQWKASADQFYPQPAPQTNSIKE